jgi:TfoX/Sxy family transcriptional regulator of competence genes
MAYDEAFAERIRAALPDRDGFSERTMFGGVGFLLHGNMCVGIWKDQLVVRLSAEGADAALERDGVHVFDVTGRAMTGWVLVDPEAMATPEALRAWIDEAVAFVSLLPAK